VLGADDLGRLEANLAALRRRIAAACAVCGRDPDGVRLVAVTKYAGASYAAALLTLGQLDLGENRVQHLLELAASLEGRALPPARWHLVGHLQRNKARKVAGLLHALHSLDDLDLARRLDAARPPDLQPLVAFVQVRLAEDEGRSGVEAQAVADLVRGLGGLTRVVPAGLMGLPPQGTPEEARPHFRGLRALAARVRQETPLGGELSMGMTADLEVAIAEGATVVRVGRALLEGLTPEALR